MKSNIDLTADRVFSNSNKIFGRICRRQIGVIRETLGDNYNPMEIIFTGGSYDRSVKRTAQKIEDGEHCDRCGAYLLRIPWRRHYGLCEQCAEAIDGVRLHGYGSGMPIKIRTDYLQMIEDRSKIIFNFL